MVCSTTMSTPRKTTRKDRNEKQLLSFEAVAKKHVKDVGVVVSVLKKKLAEANEQEDKPAIRQAHREFDSLMQDVRTRFSNVLDEIADIKTLLHNHLLQDTGRTMRKISDSGPTPAAGATAATYDAVALFSPASRTRSPSDATVNGFNGIICNGIGPVTVRPEKTRDPGTEVSVTESCSHCCSTVRTEVPADPEVVVTADEDRVKARIMEELIMLLEHTGIELFSIPASVLPDATAVAASSPDGNLMLFSDTTGSPVPALNWTSSTNGHVRSTPAAEKCGTTTTASAADSGKTLNTLRPAPSPVSSSAGYSFNYTRMGIAEWRTFLTNKHPPIEVGDTFDGLLTHYKSPAEFYMSYNQERSQALCYLIQFKCMRMRSLNVSLSDEDCSVGGLVCAKWSVDLSWYRAEITDTGPDYVEVFFIDYGNRGRVARSDLLPLEDELREFEFQTVCCILNEYNESNPVHVPIIGNLKVDLESVSGVTVKVVRKKRMGQLDTCPRFLVDLTLKYEDEETDAFKCCLTTSLTDQVHSSLS